MGEKKKILIEFNGCMDMGGIEQSLLGLLSALDYEKYDIDLFLYGHHGPWFDFLDKRVNLLPEVKELSGITEHLPIQSRYKWLWRIVNNVRTALSKRIHIAGFYERRNKSALQNVPKLEKHYDLALGFRLPFDFLKEKVDADCKIGWIHTDYTTEPSNPEYLRAQYENLDYMAAVSEQCRESFLKLFPEFEHKTVVIENTLSKSLILSRRDEFSAEKEMPCDGSVRFLTIGRFSPQKKLEEIPAICKGLRDGGLNVKWYIIGFGGTGSDYILEKIAENHMEDFVFVLGRKSNPYPYIQACDVYAQLSRWEGKSVAVREAQILCKPVVITNYATAGSQLENGVDGVIVPMDIPGSVEGIAALLGDPEKMKRLSHNCSERDYTNSSEAQKLYDFIKGN